MAEKKAALQLDDVLKGLSEDAQRIVSELHAVALKNNCKFRIDPGDAPDKYTITYSAMWYTLSINGGVVSLGTAYDIRAFMDFYKKTNDDTARELLFNAAQPCTYCIDDKCTTLISGHNRTITFWSEAENTKKEKKLCGPYNNWLSLEPITLCNLESVKAIAEMVFRYCTPEMHADILYENEITYKTATTPEFTVIGFKHAASAFSVKMEDFIQECLTKGSNGQRKIDTLLQLTGQTDNGKYIGVTTNFVNSTCYQFVFGIACGKNMIPAELPEGIVKIKVGRGEWAVYNSSARNYRSIWRHFHDNLYTAEKKGYDTYRDPFEYYDKAGNFSDVHIPISADMSQESGKYTRAVFTPDITIAGLLSCNEKDHPLYKETAGLDEKLLKYFPHTERIIKVFIHSTPGRPMLEILGVEVDKLDVIPDDLEIITLRGGWWNMVGYPYYKNGWYEIGPIAYKSRFNVDMLNHPRAFMVFDYVGRGLPDHTGSTGADCVWGLYSEFYTPIRLMGERKVELVNKPVCIIVGKEEAPPESYVTDADIQAFCDLDTNIQKGSCVFAFKFEPHGNSWFFQKPVIKGAEVANKAAKAPDGLKVYTLDGGKYMKITETLPNGELGWCVPGYSEMKKTGYEPDLSRLFFVRQLDYGREFELYVPVK